MAKSKIEWCDRVWNPISGCTKISQGCANCYAERMAHRLAGRCGYPAEEPFRVTLHPERLDEPLKWRKPQQIFVCSMGDLFHEDVPFRFIHEIWDVIKICHQHTFIVLTKRPEKMKETLEYIYSLERFGWAKGFWDHVWIGVTVENQEQADKRIPVLLQIPAAVRFVSVEPMLGPVLIRQGIDWVICGGESGPGARPMHPDWVRSLRDQCQATSVPFFFKQWGEWSSDRPDSNLSYTKESWQLNTHFYRVGKKKAGRLIDGQLWDEYPEVCN